MSFVSTSTLNSGPGRCPPWGLDSAGLVAVMDGAHRDPGQCWTVCMAAVPAAPPPGLREGRRPWGSSLRGPPGNLVQRQQTRQILSSSPGLAPPEGGGL